MPRKPLDVRKERVRLLLPKANQNPTDINQSGCCVSPLFAYIHFPKRLASSGTWTIDGDGEYLFNFNKPNYTTQEYIMFMKKTGLFDLIANHVINNIVD